MSTLTHSLGDKLMEVVGTQEGRSKRNPRSGIDLPDSLMPQNTLDSRDKNDEEVGTASQNNNNKQNNHVETHMNQTSIETNNEKSNGKRSEGSENFDNRALNVAESATRSLEKVANEGIKIAPAFKRRRAEGYAIAGAAIGVAGGAIAGTLLMSKFGTNPTNQDVTHAGYAAAVVGGVAGACTGSFVGGLLDDKAAEEKAKTEE